ncbi:helix-turn-helix domain-containing protein [Paenibacillus tarimensis]|uniref:helix-turn-helix domain-containing protein n=1 Tax=Paenibacillus tarimensis TaxID=416012 RepID=UPI001F3F12A1|nr:helix-turn-helix domain-containing protein [Paenibacillus tarimensis]MCF2945266.1 helix-turn-helix domain-containing protein [Paenibacillus tarimensis]
MDKDLYELVKLAQAGDGEAMQDIITMLLPVIRAARRSMKPDRQDDLEQNLIELIIRKVYDYDLSGVPDYTAFSRNFIDKQEGNR